MKTPIEKMIDELLDIRHYHFSENKVATDALDGILKIMTSYLDLEKSEMMEAWKSGFNYGMSGGGPGTAKSYISRKYDS